MREMTKHEACKTGDGNGSAYLCPPKLPPVVLIDVSVALDSTQHGLGRRIASVLGDGI